MGSGQSKQSPPPPATQQAENASPAPPSPAAVAAAASTLAATASSADSKSAEGEGGGCPMKNADGSYRVMPGFASLFGRMGGHPPVDTSKIGVTSSQATQSSTAAVNGGAGATTANDDNAGGCPVKHSSSSRSWNILQRGGPGPGSDGAQSDSEGQSKQQQQQRQQYDVYSRPLPMDPTNNMPLPNPSAIARNSLPAPDQSVSLPTERVSSSIPKDSASTTTWTYPSPQMFYNALARKGKLDADTKEEDMISVVAIHNCMNEGTWERILQWEEVLHPTTTKKDNGDGEKSEVVAAGPSLTKFMGRPTDLSPKAFLKHYLLNHPLPFDRHDWTVTRTNPDGSTNDVRYVIDYYHDDAAAKEEEGSGLPQMNEGIGTGGKLQSLLVDVRPAADSPSEIWGRLFTMPLARRGCRSMLECVLFKGHGSGKKSDFEPLPLSPSESLKESLGESQKVWENIQRDAMMKKGVGAKDGGGGGGEACASDSLEDDKDLVGAAAAGRASVDQTVLDETTATTMSKEEATKLATTFSQILSNCQETKAALQNCTSDEECNKAYMGMTVCAGQYMCPLQHSSLLDSLESHGNGGSVESEDVAEAKINVALDVLGECVANYDGRASVAKKQFPEVFDEILKKGR